METISINEFQKLELKTGEIISVEEISNADKLYKLTVDLGTETKTILAGLKQYYTKEELEGKKCIILCNLEPRIMKGIKSEGMILAASNDDHSEVKILQPDGVIDLGARIS